MSDNDDYLNFDLGQISEPKRELTYSEKRKIRLAESLKKGTVKPLREKEKELRDSGLKTAINAENKGFQLLKKMGFT